MNPYRIISAALVLALAAIALTVCAGLSAGRKHIDPVDDIVELCNMLAALPAVDAAPVVHGRWRQDDEDAWTCTACGNIWTFLDGGPNENNAKYCPMCGAKMDVEGDAE